MAMEIPELSATETNEFLKSHPDAKLVDVRTDEEYITARIQRAVLVNSPEKAEAILAMPTDTPLVFHCHHGMRSLQAAIWFRQKGFTNVFNLAGGIDAWSRDVDSSVPTY
jgi:monothiol glutaredoxin